MWVTTGEGLRTGSGGGTTTALPLVDPLVRPRTKGHTARGEVDLAVIRMLFRAELRQRWRSWLLLALLVALVGGLVLAGVAAGRRTANAFPGYVHAHGFDVVAYSFTPLPRLATLPEVASVIAVGGPAVGVPTCACSHKVTAYGFSLYDAPAQELPNIVKLVAGRMPDATNPDQVLASFTLESDGVHVGTVMKVPLFSPSQRTAVEESANVVPSGPTLLLHVVGIEAAEDEFPGDGDTVTNDLYGTPALARSISKQSVDFTQDYVRLRHGAADLLRFDADDQRLGGDGTEDQDTAAASITSSIHPQAVGWWILAGLTALVGAIVIGQALARQSALESADRGTLRALGVGRRPLFFVSMARTLFIAVVGVCGAVGLAYLLSPLTPVGEARLAELSNGFSFDGLVLLGGAVAAIVVVLALGVGPAVLGTRTAPLDEVARTARPSRTVVFLSGIGLPPSALIGVRHALERGRGRNAVPVGSALLGAILAVAALCATSIFGASLTHLTTTPSLYGQPFEAWVGNYGLPTDANPTLTTLLHDRTVTGITAGISGDVQINGKTVDALAGQSFRGPLLLTTVSGRLPASASEITLGATTLRQVGAHVGSVVSVTAPRPEGGSRTSPFRVVGTTSFPPDFGAGGLGTGAVFTFGGYFAAQCAPGPMHAACLKAAGTNVGGVYLLRFTPGAAGRAGLSRLAGEYGYDLSYPQTPANLVNFGEAVNFPLILGLVLIVFGVATLVHALVVSVTRRRREAGLLKALGFVRRQLALAVSWQTTTVAFVGIVVGVPLGIALGRVIWKAFAHNLGVLPLAEINGWAIVAIAAGALVVANVLAVGPAVAASRSRPADLLRSE
jgi:ABC-type lipoprotein release transport system permease subunit